MAEKSAVQDKSLEELQREVTCSICQEYYTEPKILPCLHYYCKECVLRLALRTATGQPFSCPECRSEATLPEGGVDELKTAFFVNRLQTTVSTMERTHGKVEVKCELCKEPSGHAEAFCRQCARFICQECVNIHKKITTFEDHEVASLDDLKHGRAKPISVKEPPVKKCQVHEEPLTIYCYDCNCLICRDCTMKDHREHNFEFTKKTAPNTKQKLLEEIKPLKDLHIKLTNAVEQIQATKGEIEAQKSSAINIIKSSFKELRDILDKRELQLVDEAGVTVQDKVDKLSAQEKNLSLASAEVQCVMEYTERCVRHCTDNEVMSIHNEMSERIQQKMQEHSGSGRTLEPVEEADMAVEVRCAENLQQLCQTQVVISKIPIDQSKSTVHLDAAAEVGKVSRSTLVTRLQNNRPTNRNCEVCCQIKCLHNGATTDCNISFEGSGRYSIQYTPNVRGRHELMVLIDGQHVAGSPFPMFVSIHPKQLGKPVKVWSGMQYPFGVTANSKEEVLVCECYGDIIKLANDGKREVLMTQRELVALRCIAVDDEDNIYCIDSNNSKILRCDRNGGNIQLREAKTDAGPGRTALSMIENTFYMSERNKEGSVTVYDRELKYLRHIHHEDMGEVVDISADGHGNVYMTNRSNSSIYIFDTNGVPLRSFGLETKELKAPWGIFASSQYVYITDIANHNVLVFTTNGQLVTSFGQRGSQEGQFNHPYYLLVDQDGFLYVTDCHNHRVQCF